MLKATRDSDRDGVESEDIKFGRDVMETEDIFADLLRNIFPNNLVAASFEQAQTKYNYMDQATVVNNGTLNDTINVRVVTGKYVGSAKSPNILGLVIISVVFGVATAAMGKKGDPFLSFFRSCTDVIIKILGVFIWSTPLGVASLIAVAIADTGDIASTFSKLGLFTLTVLAGQMFWVFVVLPIVYFYIKRRNPFKFFASIVPSILIVFATCSSVMALPETFHSMETRNNIDKRISRVVAPLFATMGRAASATYISVSCFFLIQMAAKSVTFVTAFLVVILTWASTLAIPSVAGSSLITVLILLTALNIPGEAAAMLFALEFFLDRCRSIANLMTQLTGIVVVQHCCAASLGVEDQRKTACDVENDAEYAKIRTVITC